MHEYHAQLFGTVLIECNRIILVNRILFIAFYKSVRTVPISVPCNKIHYQCVSPRIDSNEQHFVIPSIFLSVSLSLYRRKFRDNVPAVRIRFIQNRRNTPTESRSDLCRIVFSIREIERERHKNHTLWCKPLVSLN